MLSTLEPGLENRSCHLSRQGREVYLARGQKYKRIEQNWFSFGKNIELTANEYVWRWGV